jgi:transposase
LFVNRSDRATGFSVLPRRRVVERTFAWLNRNRQLAKDFKVKVGSSKALDLPRFGPTAHPPSRRSTNSVLEHA